MSWLLHKLRNVCIASATLKARWRVWRLKSIGRNYQWLHVGLCYIWLPKSSLLNFTRPNTRITIEKPILATAWHVLCQPTALQLRRTLTIRTQTEQIAINPQFAPGNKLYLKAVQSTQSTKLGGRVITFCPNYSFIGLRQARHMSLETISAVQYLSKAYFNCAATSSAVSTVGSSLIAFLTNCLHVPWQCSTG